MGFEGLLGKVIWITFSDNYKELKIAHGHEDGIRTVPAIVGGDHTNHRLHSSGQ
jgi:hypothetical protein